MNGGGELDEELRSIKLARFGVPRGSDSFGDGSFAASRGNHIHRGVDYAYEPGALVRSPLKGPALVTKLGYPYDDTNAAPKRFRYIELLGHNKLYIARLFYIKPEVKLGDTVYEDDALGLAQNISARYGDGMVNHVHLEMYVDPRLFMAATKGGSDATIVE